MFKYITVLEDQTPRMAKLKSIYANTIGLDVDFNKDSILILNMGESVGNYNFYSLISTFLQPNLATFNFI